MELNLKNNKYMSTAVAIFASCIIIFLAILGLIITSIVGQTQNNILGIQIFGIVLLSVWLLYFCNILFFRRTVLITETQITMMKGKNIVWELKNESLLCEYQKLTAIDFIFPSPNAALMYFKQNNSKNFVIRKIANGRLKVYALSISLKNVNEMIKLGYNVKITNNEPKQD